MKQLLQEGGNLILKDKDGNVIGAAEKIDFTSVSRREFLRDFRRFFIVLDRIHRKKFDTPIWPNKEGLYSGNIFNGSAAFLFNDQISDAEFTTNKPSVGDVDLTVPEKKEGSVRQVLGTIARADEAFEGIEYIGHKEAKDQIIFLFSYEQGGEGYSVQVDFEFVEYNNRGEPTEFEHFVHNSAWVDVRRGLRGSLHKILIQAIAKGVSRIETGKIVTTKLKKPTTAKRHRNAAIYSFSVPEGLRVKYEPLEDGTYRFVPASEASRIQDIGEIFRRLFKEKPSSPEELQKFHSFHGTLQLMTKYYSKDQAKSVFKTYLQKIFHRDFGMTIDRRMVEDQLPKENSIELFFEVFPFLKEYKEEIEKMEQVFYNTTVFKEEGDLSSAIEQYLD